MNKEQLETDIAALELLVNDTANKSKDFTAQLEQAKKDLADVNKPVLTPLQLDDIQEAIEKAVDGFDFSDNDNYSIEYGIDYDGRVHCESLELSDSYQLVESITDKVHALFVEADCPEDELDTTEDDNHKVTHVEKVI